MPSIRCFFSVSLTQLTNKALPMGFIVLGCTSAASTIAAILTLIPFFFGHFTELGEEEYLDHLGSFLKSDKDVYEAIMRE